MSEPETSTAEILVHLAYPGVPTRDYRLCEGATLADFLLISGVSTKDQAIFIEGVPPEEALRLLDGVVVTVVPRPGNAVGDEPWRAALPAFREETLFQEYLDILKDRRHKVILEEDPRA